MSGEVRGEHGDRPGENRSDTPDTWTREQRDRIRAQEDAENDPSDEFERSAASLPSDTWSRRPQRRTVDELSDHQRRELEETTGHDAGEVLAKRNAASDAARNAEREERALMHPVDGLPSDHTALLVIEAYNAGSMPYNEAVARLDSLRGQEIDPGERDESGDGDRRRVPFTAAPDTAPTVDEHADTGTTGDGDTDHIGVSSLTGEQDRDDRTGGIVDDDEDTVADLEASDTPEQRDAGETGRRLGDDSSGLLEWSTEAKRDILDAMPYKPEHREDSSIRRRTHADVYTEKGLISRDLSGIDARSAEASQMMDDYGLLPSRTRPEYHVETKIMTDMANGRLPNKITVFVDNEVCGSNDRVASCQSFAKAAWSQGVSARPRS